MIRQISLKHGWFYHYRVHEAKAENLCSNHFSELYSYLQSLFVTRPDDYFLAGPRSSSLKFDLESSLAKTDNSVSVLAKQGLKWSKYKTAHSNVQVFMLNFDKSTIGVEVPIWMLPCEYEGFKETFREECPLTGHIDVLRIENDKIWIWDFKPNAEKEKYASTQVFFYALMLSKRTGIPLNNFMCGYFDEKNAFTFNPCEAKPLIPIASLVSSY